jgi:hypothetical protein
VADEPRTDVIRHDAADSRLRIDTTGDRYKFIEPLSPVDEARIRRIAREEIRAEQERQARTTRAHRDD